MNCKKVFITSALISFICFLPGVSFSNTIQDNNIVGNFYISGKYMPTVSHFGNFSAKEEKAETKKTFGLEKNYDGAKIEDNQVQNKFTISNYSFKYEDNPFLGFAGAIGYSMEGPRIELEVSYETFNVKNQDNSYKNDAHMYYLLAREVDSSSPTKPQVNKSVLLKNEGLTDFSIMLNACYDIITDNIPFSPYICAGVGADLVSMFNSINPKLAYQGKLGISYSISPEVSAFIGGHFHKVIGNEFKDIATILPSGSSIKDNQYAIVTLSVCHFGVEIGGRVSF
uniref:Omp-1-16 n=8 Tax=Ehrlichia ewingii TaxID=947 RepID=B1N6B9_9RICK|nr:Omp-1-16 [Ehrlichia ewingii]